MGLTPDMQRFARHHLTNVSNYGNTMYIDSTGRQWLETKRAVESLNIYNVETFPTSFSLACRAYSMLLFVTPMTERIDFANSERFLGWFDPDKDFEVMIHGEATVKHALNLGLIPFINTVTFRAPDTIKRYKFPRSSARYRSHHVDTSSWPAVRASRLLDFQHWLIDHDIDASLA